jgi:hypothetical protein
MLSTTQISKLSIFSKIDKNTPLYSNKLITVTRKPFHILINKNRRFSIFRLFDENNNEIKNSKQFIEASYYCYTNHVRSDDGEILDKHPLFTLIHHEVTNSIQLRLKDNFIVKSSIVLNEDSNSSSESIPLCDEIVDYSKKFTINDIEIDYPNSRYPIRKVNLIKLLLIKKNEIPCYTNSYISQCIMNHILPNNIRFTI